MRRAFLLLACTALYSQQPYATWSDYGGSADTMQYSALKQINKSNVKQLAVAWTYSTGDSRQYLFNPIVVDGTMYVQAKDNSLVALDAATGRELWVHPFQGAVTTRGINYWESKDRGDRRIFTINAGFLTAIDARTGKTVVSFGDNGRADLRTGLDRDLTNVPQALAAARKRGQLFRSLDLEHASYFVSRMTITPNSNRMGFRLAGTVLERGDKADLLSHAVLPGTIQVPPNGQPIVLMGDAQTTGGYPKIGSVIKADLWKLAQARLNSGVRFIETTVEAARHALAEERMYVKQVESAIAMHAERLGR